MKNRKSKAPATENAAKIHEEEAQVAVKANAVPTIDAEDRESWRDLIAQEVRERLDQAAHLGISVTPVLPSCDWEEIVTYATRNDVDLDEAVARLTIDGLMANRSF